MGTLRSLFALAGAGWVLAREGVVSALPAEALPPAGRAAHRLAGLVARRRSMHRRSAERLSMALNRLGPSWVKLGQFLATRPDVVGADIAGDLELLQDRMQPFPLAEAEQRVAQSLGRPVAEIFNGFGEPVAAASIAQVHKAVRRSDGATVAVKVIRPGVRSRFRRDLDTFYTAARLQEKHVPSSRRLRPVAVVDTLNQSARIEMDLRLEAAALSELAANTAEDSGFRVPKVDWVLTGRDCLTMEWVDGIKLTEVEAVAAAGHDLNRLAENLMQSFLRHTLRDGFFHADMHPGNLFVDAAGDIVAVDLGITGRLGRHERRFLAEILYGFITRDYLRVAAVHFEAGYVPRRHSVESFAQAIRAIGEPIHDQPADTISMAKLLTLLFEVTELFDMQTRPELLLLQKTMVVVEGVARTLDPAFNMWKTSEPVVGDWIRRNLGPAGMLEDAREGLTSAGHLLRTLPELAERAELLSQSMAEMTENGMRLDEETVEAIGRAEARRNRWGNLALWAIAVLLAMVVFNMN
ncbi:MAG: 2-polyprenylphenol 6-hydroxylase [Pseudomonadota bacterium]|nr:2-polyprenylphenol 6-hydroxylase [Pseudomonadota bacterium]